MFQFDEVGAPWYPQLNVIFFFRNNGYRLHLLRLFTEMLLAGKSNKLIVFSLNFYYNLYSLLTTES